MRPNTKGYSTAGAYGTAFHPHLVETAASLNEATNISTGAFGTLHSKSGLNSDCEERLQQLTEQYDRRLKSLYAEIAKIHANLSHDEVLSAMKENATSSDFIGQRVKVPLTHSIHPR